MTVAPLLVVAAAILMSFIVRNVDAAREATARAHVTQAQIQEIFSLVESAESGQRGFVLTGRQGFLDASKDGLQALEGRLDALEKRMAEDPAQAGLVQRMRAQVRAKLGVMERILSIYQAQGREAAAAYIAEERGKRAMDELRLTVRQMIDQENRALDERIQAADRQEGPLRLVARSLVATFVACILLAGWLARKNLRMREELLEQLNAQAARTVGIFDSTMDAIIIFNPSGSVENLNKAAERMFGYRPEELMRRDSSMVMDIAPGEGLFLERLGMESELGAVAREFTAHRKDGSTFPAEAALGALRQPDGVHVVAAIRDITERKENERLKDDFVSSVSHELRTPLTAIAGALGLLQAGAAGELPEKSQRLVTIAKTSCDRLVRLINDLLDIQKMAAGRVRLDMRPLNMISIAGRAMESMEAFAAERKVRMEVIAPDGRLPVIGDADRLIQVMTNLLSNAIKHSPEGEVVDITLKEQGPQVTVCVGDRGPGVPEAFQASLFSRFAQAEGPSSRNSGGSGLGLAISREIAERHRGRLFLHESSSKGAVFRLELPLAASSASPVQAARTRLLLCEDDPDVAEVLAISLERDGFQVVRVGTLADAEAVIRRGGIDAVLLDLHLPDGHGLNLARRLRGEPAFRDLPVIVVTADTMANLSGLTFADWITKPVDLARLRQSVIAALHGRADLRILHVDDDVELTEVVKTALAGCGRVEAAHSLAEAREAIDRRAPDLIILDIGLPDGSGLDLLPVLARDGPPPPVIIYSGQEVEADVIGGVEAVLTKSRVSFEALAQTVKGLTKKPEEIV